MARGLDSPRVVSGTFRGLGRSPNQSMLLSSEPFQRAHLNETRRPARNRPRQDNAYDAPKSVVPCYVIRFLVFLLALA